MSAQSAHRSALRKIGKGERAADAPSKTRDSSRRIDREVLPLSQFFLCFWLDPKAPKDQAPRKVAEAVRSGRPRACHVRTQPNNHRCAKRTTSSALHRRQEQIERRFERPDRVCANGVDLACPLRENRRPIPTEVPCGHFWRHLLVTKGGKSAPCRRHPIGGAGCARNENRLFLQCDPAGRRPAKIQFRKIRSSAAAEERKPAAAHAEGGIAPPAASGTSSAGRGLTKGDRTLAAPRIFRLGKKQINLHCFRLFVSLACRRYFRSAMFE